MQSNADFIPKFTKKSDYVFRVQLKQQEYFGELIAAFSKHVQLQYFDLKKKTFVFTETHITGLATMLAHRDTIETSCFSFANHSKY